jgi:hypothetical protein
MPNCELVGLPFRATLRTALPPIARGDIRRQLQGQPLPSPLDTLKRAPGGGEGLHAPGSNIAVRIGSL